MTQDKFQPGDEVRRNTSVHIDSDARTKRYIVGRMKDGRWVYEVYVHGTYDGIFAIDEHLLEHVPNIRQQTIDRFVEWRLMHPSTALTLVKRSAEAAYDAGLLKDVGT